MKEDTQKEEKKHLYVDTVIRVNGKPVTVSAMVEQEDISARAYLKEVGRTAAEFDFTSVEQLSKWVDSIVDAYNKVSGTIKNIPEEYKN